MAEIRGVKSGSVAGPIPAASSRHHPSQFGVSAESFAEAPPSLGASVSFGVTMGPGGFSSPNSSALIRANSAHPASGNSSSGAGIGQGPVLAHSPNSRFPANGIPQEVLDDPTLAPTAFRTTAEVNTMFLDGLRKLLDENKDWRKTFQAHDAVRSVLKQHGAATVITGGLLTLAAASAVKSDRNLANWGCLLLFTGVSVFFSAIEAYFLWARAMERRHRCIKAIEQVIGLDGGKQHSQQHALTSSPGKGMHPSAVVGFANPVRGIDGIVCGLQGDSFRPHYILRDGGIQLIPKLLVAFGDVVLNQRNLKYSIYTESQSCSKLCDALKIALERTSIVLKPTEIAPPPRLPNMPMEDSDGEEGDSSTDESDLEREPRSIETAGQTATVPQQFEYFVRRLLVLLWCFTLGLLLLVGLARAIAMSNFGVNFAIFPSIAALGLLPLNVLLAQRCLVLGANATLSLQARQLEGKARYTNMYHEEDEDLPTPGIMAMLSELIALLRVKTSRQRAMCFWRSPVETLGTTTVLAPLDNDGILTDMIPVPNRILLVNPRVEEEHGDADGESNSDEDAPAEEDAYYLSEQSKKRMKTKKRKLKMQVRRKRFQESRFTQMELHVSGDDRLAVAFEDDRLLAAKRTAVNSLALCVLLHSVHNASTMPTNPRNATAKRLDRTTLWARCMHWLPVAAGFKDTLAMQFLPIRRIFCLKTDGSTNKMNPQMCVLILLRGEELHAFTIGTVDMVAQACSTYWTGEKLEEFTLDEKKEIKVVGVDQWEHVRQFQTIACSHRVLSKRYHALLVPKGTHQAVSQASAAPGSGPSPTVARQVIEDYYINGERVTGDDEGGSAPSSPVTAVASSRRGSRSFAGPKSLSERSKKDAEMYMGLDCEKLQEKESGGRSDGDEPMADEDDDLFDDVDQGGVQRKPKYLSQLTTANVIDRLVTSKQSFLGLVGLRDLVRPNVESVVNVLAGAGIRFMHFGNASEQHTKAFGARIGLEAEWNSCISLKPDMVALDSHSVRAQLPFGIQSIRRHIKFVDRIPLQVSLFSHSKTVSTRSMISILQDNHEVVCVLGSGLNHGDIRSFLQGDIAITTAPSFKSVATEKADYINREGETKPYFSTDLNGGTWKTLRNVEHLTSSICAFHVPPSDSSLTFIVALIRESRSLLKAISNCTEFMIQGNCAVVLLHVVSFFLGLPMVLSATDTIWYLNIIVPVLGLGVCYRGMTSIDVMSHMASKHCYSLRWEMFRYSSTLFFIRYVPTTMALLLVSIISLVEQTGRSLFSILWSFKPIEGAVLDNAQSLVLTAACYFNVFHSLTHISRHQRLRIWAPASRRKQDCVYIIFRVRWMVASILALLIHTAYISISLQRTPKASVGLVLFIVLWPIVIIAADFPLKRYRSKLFSDRQKLAKLMFGTRLGMHSPTGDYEPVDVSRTAHHFEKQNQSQENREGLDEVLDGDGGDSGGESPKGTAPLIKLKLRDRWRHFVFQFVTMYRGRLEQDCACCEHILPAGQTFERRDPKTLKPVLPN